MQDAQEFFETYSSMTDDELLRIYADKESLVWKAREAMEKELYKRKLNQPHNSSEPEGLSKILNSAQQSQRHKELVQLLSMSWCP